MPDRLVRFAESFFDDLDAQLPAERSAEGAASATDFLLYDLPRLRDALAADFEGRTLPVPDLAPMRVLIAAGTLVRSVALYAWLDPVGTSSSLPSRSNDTPKTRMMMTDDNRRQCHSHP